MLQGHKENGQLLVSHSQIHSDTGLLYMGACALSEILKASSGIQMQLFFYLPSSQVLAKTASLLHRFCAVFLSSSLTVFIRNNLRRQVLQPVLNVKRSMMRLSPTSFNSACSCCSFCWGCSCSQRPPLIQHHTLEKKEK